VIISKRKTIRIKNERDEGEKKALEKYWDIKNNTLRGSSFN